MGSGGSTAGGNLHGWELGGSGESPPPRRGKVRVGYSNARLYFCLPLAFKQCFTRVGGSGAETLAGSSPGPSGDQGGAGRRTSPPASVARVPEFGVWGALWADLWPLQPVKNRIPGEGRPCFLFSLVPPPNLSETFENKILFVVPPIITQLWTVDVQCLMARRAGRGWRSEGRGCPPRRQEFPRTICRRSAFLWPVSSRLRPRARGFGGWVW